MMGRRRERRGDATLGHAPGVRWTTTHAERERERPDKMRRSLNYGPTDAFRIESP